MYILWFFKVLKFHIFLLIVETIVQPPKTWKKMHKSYYILAWHVHLEKSVRPNFSPLEHVVNNLLFFLVRLSVMFDNLLMYEAHDNSV
jgi:hypothetical protein